MNRPCLDHAILSYMVPSRFLAGMMVVAILTGNATWSSAHAQGAAQPGQASSGVPEAPIGHRQPNARDVPADRAADFVLGYTCANDVTAHDWRDDGQWTRAKSADTFCPMGPWIETDIANPSALRITTRLGGQVVQEGSTSDMVFGIGELLAFVTRWITLEPGDVLLTGSPAGVGPMAPGDIVEVEISGIGTLRNTVADRG